MTKEDVRTYGLVLLFIYSLSVGLSYFEDSSPLGEALFINLLAYCVMGMVALGLTCVVILIRPTEGKQ